LTFWWIVEPITTTRFASWHHKSSWRWHLSIASPVNGSAVTTSHRMPLRADISTNAYASAVSNFQPSG
jgi:hypothetical protein